MLPQGFGKKHFFGQKTVEQRHTCHGSAGYHGERGSNWHVAEQSAQLAHVACSCFVINDPGSHEQGSLKRSVV